LLGDVEIASVVKESSMTAVYELSVDSCHTYFAGGVLVHKKFI
jgi:hypothetical protein